MSPDDILEIINSRAKIRHHAFHIFETIIGSGCADVLKSKLRSIAVQKPLQQYSWGVSNDAIYENLLDVMDDIAETDPRAFSLLSHAGYNQIDVGVPAPAMLVRELAGLPNPRFDKRTVGGRSYDSLFFECLRVICVELGRDLSSKDLPIRATIKKTSMRGGPNCERGESAHSVVTDVYFPRMLESPKGIFAYTDMNNFVTLGWRAQSPGAEFDDEGNLVSKRRSGLTFDPISKKWAWKKASNLSEFPGSRIRHVWNVPTSMNMPGIALSSAIMDNLEGRFEAIWKKITLDDLREWAVDCITHETDFSKFDSSVTRDVRNFVAWHLYSDDMIASSNAIDSLPIACSFVGLGENGGAKAYHSFIDTRDPLTAELWDSLRSGTGPTNLEGKLVGAANQLRQVCIAGDISPEDAIAVVDGVCVMSESIRNGGDDASTNITRLFAALQKRNLLPEGVSSEEELARRHFKAITEHKLFDTTVEIPGKFLGFLMFNGSLDPKDLEASIITRNTWVGNDPLSMLLNNTNHEASFDSPLRGSEFLGLRDGINQYVDTNKGGPLEDFCVFLKDVLLEVIECPFSWEEIERKAEEEMIELGTSDDNYSKAVGAAVSLLGLKNPTELDWKISKGEVWSKLPDWIKQELWIVIPEQLVSDPYKFVNFSRKTDDFKFVKPQLSQLTNVGRTEVDVTGSSGGSIDVIIVPPGGGKSTLVAERPDLFVDSDAVAQEWGIEVNGDSFRELREQGGFNFKWVSELVKGRTLLSNTDPFWLSEKGAQATIWKENTNLIGVIRYSPDDYVKHVSGLTKRPQLRRDFDDATLRKWMEDMEKRYAHDNVLLLSPGSFVTEESVARLRAQQNAKVEKKAK